MPGSDAEPPHSIVAELSETLASLEREACDLAAQIAATAAREAEAAGGDPASAVRLALAEHVLPLSAKEELATARERYLEGLRRRRLRLHREGQVLAERAVALAAESARLRAARAALAAESARLRERGIQAQRHLAAARHQRESLLQWAAASASHRQALNDWAARLSRHAQRVGDSVVPLSPDEASRADRS